MRHETAGRSDPLAMTTLSAEWNMLSAEEQQEFLRRPAPQCRPKFAKRRRRGAIGAEHTPWGLGDARFPLNADILGEIAGQVDALHNRWLTRVSALIAPNGNVADIPPRSEEPCCKRLGLGCCKQDTDEAFLDRVDGIRNLLRKVVHDVDSKGFLDNNDKIPDLRLYLLSEVATLADLVRGRAVHEPAPLFSLVLRMSTLLNPYQVVVLECKLAAADVLAVGSVIEANMTDCIDDMYTNWAFARELVRRGFTTLHIFRVAFDFVSLSTFRIVDIHPVAAENLQARRGPRIKDPVLELLRKANRPRPRNTRRRQGGGGRCRRAARDAVGDAANESGKADESEADTPTVSSEVSSDSSDTSDINESSTSSEASSSGTQVGLMQIEAPDDWHGAVAEADLASLPTWNNLTRRVQDSEGVYLGRIAPMHVGTRREAWTVFCKKHGCSICKTSAAFPEITPNVMRWFAAGQLLAGPNSKAAHMEMWARVTSA